MIKLVLIVVLFLGMTPIGWSAPRRVLSTTVGKVSDHIVTSREVKINHLVELALNNKVVKAPVLKLSQGSEFKKETSSVLMEWVVYLESHSFNVKQISSSEITKARNNVISKLQRHAGWKTLEVAVPELDELLQRKLQSKAFIRFRVKSSVIPITDEEAQKYYEEHKTDKFGDLAFSMFEKNIKAFLKKRQMDQRMRDWFEVLRRKYNVSHLSIEI